MSSLDQETSTKILHQVEFYFSDSNLPRDDFLRKTVSQSKDGMVSLALICSFSRIRGYLGLGKIKREDIPDHMLKSVAEILRKSSFVKVSDDGKKVGRVKELSMPEEVIEEVDARTVAAMPFEYAIKIQDVESFFAKFGKVNSVRLPRHVTNKNFFCGTALIEFATPKVAEEVLKKNLAYAGLSLELKPKKEFDLQRKKIMEKTEKFHSSTSLNHEIVACTASHSSYPRGLIIAFSIKKRVVGKSVKGNSTVESVTNNRKLLVSKEHAVEDVENMSEDLVETAEMKETCRSGHEVLQEVINVEAVMKNAGESNEGLITEDIKKKNSQDAIGKSGNNSPYTVCEESNKKATISRKEMHAISCEELKSVFQRFGAVKHVDYRKGEDSGYIHFEKLEAVIRAHAAAEFIGGSLVVKRVSENFSAKVFEASWDAITGETEKEYWDMFHHNEEESRKRKRKCNKVEAPAPVEKSM